MPATPSGFARFYCATCGKFLKSADVHDEASAQRTHRQNTSTSSKARLALASVGSGARANPRVGDEDYHGKALSALLATVRRTGRHLLRCEDRTPVRKLIVEGTVIDAQWRDYAVAAAGQRG